MTRKKKVKVEKQTGGQHRPSEAADTTRLSDNSDFERSSQKRVARDENNSRDGDSGEEHTARSKTSLEDDVSRGTSREQNLAEDHHDEVSASSGGKEGSGVEGCRPPPAPPRSTDEIIEDLLVQIVRKIRREEVLTSSEANLWSSFAGPRVSAPGQVGMGSEGSCGRKPREDPPPSINMKDPDLDTYMQDLEAWSLASKVTPSNVPLHAHLHLPDGPRRYLRSVISNLRDLENMDIGVYVSMLRGFFGPPDTEFTYRRRIVKTFLDNNISLRERIRRMDQLMLAPKSPLDEGTKQFFLLDALYNVDRDLYKACALDPATKREFPDYQSLRDYANILVTQWEESRPSSYRHALVSARGGSDGGVKRKPEHRSSGRDFGPAGNRGAPSASGSGDKKSHSGGASGSGFKIPFVRGLDQKYKDKCSARFGKGVCFFCHKKGHDYSQCPDLLGNKSTDIRVKPVPPS